MLVDEIIYKMKSDFFFLFLFFVYSSPLVYNILNSFDCIREVQCSFLSKTKWILVLGSSYRKNVLELLICKEVFVIIIKQNQLFLN